jgi:hypothetical protein
VVAILAGRYSLGNSSTEDATTHQCQNVGIVWHDSSTSMIGPLICRTMALAVFSMRIADLSQASLRFLLLHMRRPPSPKRPAFECPIEAGEESSEAGPWGSGRGSRKSGHRPRRWKRGDSVRVHSLDWRSYRIPQLNPSFPT